MCSRFSSCPLFEKRRFVAASPLPVKRAALREHEIYRLGRHAHL